MKVTRRVEEMVGNAEAIAYWHTLDLTKQTIYYEMGKAEIKSSVRMESAYGKLGQRGYFGPGCSLAEAIDRAYAESDEIREQRRQYIENEHTSRMIREYQAYVVGYAIVNDRRFKLTDCPEFIQNIAYKNAKTAADQYGWEI